ncbi:MAG: putative outer membrane protein [Gemmatimonadetes bacterium]|jgi:putative membrane protein|nr:putative outer membrane protein [Gemmatimonadota bacterium]
MKSRIGLVALVALSGCSTLLPGPSRTAASASETPAAALADAHVAGIALVANNVEIGYALLVPGRASDPDVREYAARMHTDHTSLNATLTDLLARLDLPAEDDPAGLALRDASTARRDRLRALTGRAFDAAYLDVDLASHRELLHVIDRVLAPGTRRRELQDYVAAMRPVVAAHLAHAEQLRVTVAARQR